MAILADVVLHPIFPQSEFDRERRLQLDALAQQSKDANALVSRIRPMLVFGSTHPYGRPVSGLPSTVNAITRDDLVKAHAASWKPGSTAVVFAGDISLDGARQLTQNTSAPGAAAPRRRSTFPRRSLPRPGSTSSIGPFRANGDCAVPGGAAPERRRLLRVPPGRRRLGRRRIRHAPQSQPA